MRTTLSLPLHPNTLCGVWSAGVGEYGSRSIQYMKNMYMVVFIGSNFPIVIFFFPNVT